MKSEFGKGLTYCLGLFLCHSERVINEDDRLKFTNVYEIWFNSAADHLFDLEIPESLPKSLQDRLRDFQNKVLNWRLALDNNNIFPTKENKFWAIKEAKTLLRLIDESFGVKSLEGEYE